MKRLHTAIAALLVLLCGCGAGTSPYGILDVEKIDQAGAFSEPLEVLDQDVAFLLYGLADQGLEEGDITAFAALRSAGATCEEGAVLVFSTEEQAGKAKTALEGYVQRQIEANEDYRPAEIPKLENAFVDRRGNSVLLIVANDLDAAKDALQSEPSV